jgi:hypothetical protein
VELAGGRRVLRDGQNGELIVAVVLADDDDLVGVDEDHLSLRVALAGGHLAISLRPGARLDLLLLLEQLDGGDGGGSLLLLPPLLSRGRHRGLHEGPRELLLFLEVAAAPADDGPRR